MTDKKISELANITGANLADSDEFVVVDSSASETKAITRSELGLGINKLGYNGTQKIITTSTGVDVTGTVTADGLTVVGNGTKYNAITINGGHVSDGGNDYGLTINSFEPAITMLDRTTGAGSVQLFGTSNGGLWIVGDTTNDGTIGHSTNTTDFLVAKFEPINTIFYTSGAESMRINSSGNVLLGDTTARATVNSTGTSVFTPSLQRTGTTENASSIGLFNYSTSTGSDPAIAFSKSLNATIGLHTAVTSGTQLGGITWNGSDGSGFVSAANIAAYADANASSGSLPGRLDFETAGPGDTSPQQRMTIDSAGFVGIGTSDPVDKFTVSGGVVRVENNNGELFSGFCGVNNNSQPNVIVSQSRGTVAAPTETQAGDRLLGLLARGHNGTAYTGFSASLQFHAEGSGSAGGTYAALHTAPVGSSTRTERMRIDSSGNVGIGVTPSAWNSSATAIEYKNGVALYSFGVASNSNLITNAFVNSGGTFTYKTSDFAARYQSISGQHQWYTAPSGTAGNAITFTQAMTLSNAGGLSVGSTADAGAGNLLLTGNVFSNQPAPTAKTATATLTIAELLTNIITVTSATAVSLTLPTGTLTDAGIMSGALPVNGSFDWSIINLGSSSGAVTMVAGTGHTYVGNATVAISTSARFRTRKTAANTYVTYRIS